MPSIREEESAKRVASSSRFLGLRSFELVDAMELLRFIVS